MGSGVQKLFPFDMIIFQCTVRKKQTNMPVWIRGFNKLGGKKINSLELFLDPNCNSLFRFLKLTIVLVAFVSILY